MRIYHYVAIEFVTDDLWYFPSNPELEAFVLSLGESIEVVR